MFFFSFLLFPCIRFHNLIFPYFVPLDSRFQFPFISKSKRMNTFFQHFSSSNSTPAYKYFLNFSSFVRDWNHCIKLREFVVVLSIRFYVYTGANKGCRLPPFSVRRVLFSCL